MDRRAHTFLTPALSHYQVGLAKKVEKPSRKLRKERKNRAKKVTGVAKKKAGDPAKKK
jgi:small subunit ribosomal protein S24e